MRPALLRLLKRPSTLSILESLLSSTSELKHPQAQVCTQCLRRQSFASQPSNRDLLSAPLRKNRPTRISTRASSSVAPHRDHAALRSNDPSQWKGLDLQLEKLEFESDIGHTRAIGTRLVDSPDHRNDLELWLELLLYRRRHYGDDGVSHIWEGLTKRVGGLHLPVEGEAADILWQSFVDVGLRKEALLNEVINYAQELWNQTGRRWPKLYQSIVGWFVKHGEGYQAVKWHRRIQDPHLPDPSDIGHCFTAALADYKGPGKDSVTVRARLLAFRQICKHTDGHRVYGQVIQTLMRSKKTKELLQMHQFLIDRGDHPRSLEELQPLLQFVHMFSRNATKERIVQYVNERFKSGEATGPSLEQAQESDAPNEVAENGFNDDFGARIFATKALPLEMIISGLKTFNVQAIGPLSLREMARRAGGAKDILEKLERLKNSNISVKDSLFTRLLHRFAEEDHELLPDLIHIDQHHDVLEDRKTQAMLLSSYYVAGEMRQHDLTLVVLKELFGEGPDLQTIQLQKHISAGERSKGLDIVSNMLIQGITPNQDTINWTVNSLFGPRQPGLRPTHQPHSHPGRPLPEIFRLLQRLSLEGADVPIKLWNELLKRTGMADHWDDLRTYCLWLANHYTAPTDSAEKTQIRHLTLQKLFDRYMQEAIVHWGFIANPPRRLLYESYHATGPKGERLVPFARGLMLLRELQHRGVDVRVSLVRRTCEQRLVMLYGKKPFKSELTRNRSLREINPYPLVWVVRDLNLAWGEDPLFTSSRRQWLHRFLQTHLPSLSTKEKWRKKNQESPRKMKQIMEWKRQERESGHQGEPRTRGYNVISYL